MPLTTGSTPLRLSAPGAALGRSVGFAAAWLAYFGVLQWSVVRYRVPIVVVLTLATLLLAAWQWRGWSVRLSTPAVALALGGSAVVTLTVPLFSYLGSTGLTLATTVLVLGALGCAGLLAWSGSRSGSAAAGAAGAAALLAAASHVVVAVVAIRSDRAPRIDVWVTLQQASEAITRGESFYEVTWTGSPGIQDAFTYLPWTAVLLAPGKWVFGDVRWAMLLWSLVALAGIWALARPLPRDGEQQGDADEQHWRWTAAAAIALVAFTPGTLTQVDQSWTEPLLLAGLVWWAVLVRRGHAWWAIVPLALACASKQHLALLLPVLMVWRPFGPRRAIATGALTAALIAPWFLAGPADFVHDTITLLVQFHAIRFANTLYLLALNTFGVTLPFWVTGVAVLGTLAATAVAVQRRQPPLGTMLRWLSLVLLVATMVNKQGFYNQFWLVGALVVASLATRVAVGSQEVIESGPASRPPTGAQVVHDRTAATSAGSPRG